METFVFKAHVDFFNVHIHIKEDIHPPQQGSLGETRTEEEQGLEKEKVSKDKIYLKEKYMIGKT